MTRKLILWRRGIFSVVTFCVMRTADDNRGLPYRLVRLLRVAMGRPCSSNVKQERKHTIRQSKNERAELFMEMWNSSKRGNEPTDVAAKSAFGRYWVPISAGKWYDVRLQWFHPICKIIAIITFNFHFLLFDFTVTISHFRQSTQSTWQEF